MSDIKKRPFLTVFGFLLFALIFAFLIFGFSHFRETLFLDNDADNTVNLPTIVIDAGHGGRDGGAVGYDKTTVEKDLNLDISKKLQRLLCDAGYTVVMTRKEDIMLEDPMITSSKKASDLAARRKIMDSVDNAVFVSIHMNAFSDSRYSGLQVYYSQNDARSQSLALSVQNRIAATLQPENTRKIKAANENIFLLNKAKCPAVLIECGFLSNPSECSRLSEESYRAELSYVISEAISEYISQNH
ncbi:MAG: hypothetical protein E7640_03485 [Ruminococcaceae bacterium]|nr:hypothetical protein [Oscillospiraceae bacterium]